MLCGAWIVGLQAAKINFGERLCVADVGVSETPWGINQHGPFGLMIKPDAALVGLHLMPGCHFAVTLLFASVDAQSHKADISVNIKMSS